MIKTICKKCQTPIEQDGVRSMKRCSGCGIKWGFTVNIDKTVHLFENGAKRKNDDDRKKPYSISWNKKQDKKARAKGYTRQQCADFGYNVLVLCLDKDDALSIII